MTAIVHDLGARLAARRMKQQLAEHTAAFVARRDAETFDRYGPPDAELAAAVRDGSGYGPRAVRVTLARDLGSVIAVVDGRRYEYPHITVEVWRHLNQVAEQEPVTAGGPVQVRQSWAPQSLLGVVSADPGAPRVEISMTVRPAERAAVRKHLMRVLRAVSHGRADELLFVRAVAGSGGAP